MLVFLSATAAFAGLMFLSSAHAQSTSAPVSGDWTGKYICAQGVTALDLHIDKTGGNAIKATFSFGPLPENPDVPKGLYEMRGTFDPSTRSVILHGARWISEPDGYVMVDLKGRVAQTGQNISGVVPGLAGCTNFEIWRAAELIG
jgi:hypothetical protein